MKKVMFISSTGGHLTELLNLKKMFKKYDYSIITENTKSNKALKSEYPGKVHYVLYGTKHNKIKYPFVVIINCLMCLYYYIKIRPRVIITTGAHTAGPMCCIAKIFGAKIIIVQWESMLKLYPKATYGGWIF